VKNSEKLKIAAWRKAENRKSAKTKWRQLKNIENQRKRKWQRNGENSGEMASEISERKKTA
jgi:hypothetical protein